MKLPKAPRFPMGSGTQLRRYRATTQIRRILLVSSLLALLSTSAWGQSEAPGPQAATVTAPETGTENQDQPEAPPEGSRPLPRADQPIAASKESGPPQISAQETPIHPASDGSAPAPTPAQPVADEAEPGTQVDGQSTAGTETPVPADGDQAPVQGSEENPALESTAPAQNARDVAGPKAGVGEEAAKTGEAGEQTATSSEEHTKPSTVDSAGVSAASGAAPTLNGAAPTQNGASPEEEAAPPRSTEEQEVHRRIAELGREEVREEDLTELDRKLFPTAPTIERQKEFWIRIFTEFSSRQGLIHNGWLTQPVYEEVDLEGMSRRQQRRYVKQRKKAIVKELRKLAADLETGREPGEEGARLLAVFPKDVTPETLRRNAKEVRFQRGLANRFVQGLKTSGSVLAKIKIILAEHGVPKDLAYLPHVESSFNLLAYSKFGAAGIWQFTRGTGKMYLTIKYEVDERLDPLLATEAAARFMKRNFQRLQSWPLAITGYNHGPLGVERIVKKLGTKQLEVMIQNYHGRAFKFASKNFYAEFLAAREVATHYEKYFGPLELDPPLNFATVELPFYLDFALAGQLLKVNPRELKRLNPSLRTSVIVGAKYIPKGYELRMPPERKSKAFLASVPGDQRFKRQKRTEVVRVRRGDTLYALGRRYGVPWTIIAQANNITGFHRIRPGQRLVIPRRGPGKRWIAKSVPVPEPKNLQAVVARVNIPKGPRGKPEVMPLPDTSIAFQKADGASMFQDLGLKNLNPARQTGQIITAYGETLGHYATWARVTTRTVRRYSGQRYGTKLQPGQLLVIPLTEASEEQFSQSRFEFHQSREEDFYSTYAVAEANKVKVRRGDSVWKLAQSNNIPMWLFYQHNASLINAPIRRGMTVLLPVIEELAELGSAPVTVPAPPVSKAQ